jgi:hypothetical protein
MSLVLQSSGGGQITIQEPTTASNFTQNLPAVNGTVITTGNIPTGSILQVYSTNITPDITTTSQMSISATPTVAQGAELVSASFTPISASSKIIIQCIGSNVRPTGTSNVIIALFQDSTCLSANTPRSTTAEPEVTLGLLWAGTSGSTSARTYSVRVAPQNAVTLYVNNVNSVARFTSIAVYGFTIFEVAA